MNSAESPGRLQWIPSSDRSAVRLPHQIEALVSSAFRLTIRLESVIRVTCICDAGSRMSIKLYVGNFPCETSESDLRTLFEASGEVASVSVMRDRATGLAHGFAFVEMSNVVGARKAVRQLDKQQYGGRSLAVGVRRRRLESS